jgi:hypothetical protein
MLEPLFEQLADGDMGSSENFTIRNSQDICLLHVSDKIAAASGELDTEINFNTLDCVS